MSNPRGVKKGAFTKQQYYEMLKEIVKCSGHMYTDKLLEFIEQQQAIVAKKAKTDMKLQDRGREQNQVLTDLILEILTYDRPQNAKQISDQVSDLIGDLVPEKSVQMRLMPLVDAHTVAKRENTIDKKFIMYQFLKIRNELTKGHGGTGQHEILFKL